ncbi:MAG: PAS domain S-box protein [Candidatus Electrothrix sp. GW3-4]|uniref:PAS domain S-box protein n=1 Tax=Candidatus Electrothrix sp. GW3-4 TaxID=3126740 RepID=UPI0030CF2097
MAKSRKLAIEQFLSKLEQTSWQITSHTKTLEKLQQYNQGEVSLQEFADLSRPILEDALHLSQEAVGCLRFDKNGEPIVQAGLPIPASFQVLPRGEKAEVRMYGPVSIDHELYLIVTTPIFDRNKTQVGTDLVLFQLAELKTIVQDHTGPGKSEKTILGVVDNKGQVRVFFPLEKMAKGSAGYVNLNSPIGSAMEQATHLSRDEYRLLRPSFDRSQVFAYSPIAEINNWAIVVQMDAQELYAPFKRQVITLCFVIFILLVLGTLGTILLLRPWDKKILIHTEKLEFANQQLVPEIEERKQAETVLRDSEERSHTLIQKVPTAIVLHDDQGQILASNPMAQQLLGLSEDQLLGRALIDPNWHFLREDRSVMPLAEYPVSRALASQQPLRDYVVGICRPDQDEITWVLTNAEPDYDNAGEIALIIVSFIDISKRKQVEEALQDSKRRLTEAQHLAHLGSWELNLTNNMLTWSDETFQIFEINQKKFGATYEALLEAIHPDDREAVNSLYTNSLKNKTPYSIDHRLLFPDGRIKYVHEQCETFYDGEIPVRSIGTVQDITEGKLTEEALHRLNRELRAISDCNQLLMRADNEQTLLNEICRIICNETDYRMAWVGYAKKDKEKSVRPVAWAGVEEGYLATVNITWADTERGRGPTGTTIRTGESSCIQDCTAAPKAGPWRKEILPRGCRSSIALPLKDENAVPFGALCIYSMEPNTFTPDENRLLEELAGDLAFGIISLRTRAELKKAVEALQENQKLLLEAQQMAHIGNWWHDLITGELYWSDEFFRILGIEPQKPTNELAVTLIHPDDLPILQKAMEKSVAGKMEHEHEFRIIRPDGEIRWIHNHWFRINDKKGKEIKRIGTHQDITERKRHDAINVARLHLTQFAATHSKDELLEETLKQAEKLTGSFIGFYHFVAADQTTLTLQSWSARTKAEFCTAEGKGLHYSIAEAGVWVECVRLGKPVIHNDCASLPHRKGMPEGHAQVIRELVVPVMRDEKIQAILGVGNKATDYTEKDQEALALLADLTWEVVERKRAEEKILWSEQRLRLHSEQSPLGFLEWDVNFRAVEWNAACERIFGYTREEAVGQQAKDLILPPEMHELGNDIYQNLMNQASGQHSINENITKDGRIIICEWFNTTLIDKDGKPIGVASVCRDISEQKRMEQKLIAQEQEYRTLIENVPDFIVRYDLDLRRIYVNPSLEKASGLAAGEVIGMTPVNIPKVSRPTVIAYKEKLRQTITTGNKQRAEFSWVNTAGEKLVLDYLMVPEFDPKGKICGVLSVGHDITERKQTEESIRRLSQVVEQSPVSVIITDLSGKIEFVNEKFSQLTGYTAEEALGQNPKILQSGETPVEEYHQLWQTISSGGVWQGEFHNRKKNGELFWEHATVFAIRTADNLITHYAAVKEDITEQKILEEQLRQIQKMEAVGQLAGGVAHDFNNMLGVIIGYTELALLKTTQDTSLRQDLEQILAASHRSAEITQQLLAFARKQTIAPKVLHLNETIEGTLKLLRRLIGEDIDLVWQPGAKLWAIRMDPVQIDQILANLCVNARDAITSIGRVTIETHNVELDETYCAQHQGFLAGAYVLLAVSDTGKGMDKAMVDKIFEPFFTTKGLGKGTGLGLSTVYGIVKQNGGVINVYSEPGHGSIFKIYLPRHRLETEQTAKEDRKAPVIRGSETILLVEDEVAVLDLTKRILEKLGYTVLSSLTPSQAIPIATEHSSAIHLLITDVIMPEMTGQELANNLTSLCPSLKCLFMSGYTGNVIAHHGVLDEGVNFIQKPFSMQELGVKIREALDK